MSDRGPRFVWVDGSTRPAQGTHLSVFDRGFQLGDGVFETLRVGHGRVSELAEHTARLRASADTLGITLPTDAGAIIAQGIADLIAAEGLDAPTSNASVRVTVSRGPIRSRTLLPTESEAVPPTIAIQAWPVVPPRHTPGELPPAVTLVSSAIRHDPDNPLVRVKTTSRAEYVYARLEARRAGADDVVFHTTSGHLAEATQASIFLVRVAPDGVGELATPSLECGILPGTTRAWLLDWAARVGLRPVEGWLRPEDLATASEAFLSSSVAGVVPIASVDGELIGDGRPGPWTIRARTDRERHIVEGV